jgi:hypothetical protein
LASFGKTFQKNFGEKSILKRKYHVDSNQLLDVCLAALAHLLLFKQKKNELKKKKKKKKTKEEAQKLEKEAETRELGRLYLLGFEGTFLLLLVLSVLPFLQLFGSFLRIVSFKILFNQPLNLCFMGFSRLLHRFAVFRLLNLL